MGDTNIKTDVLISGAGPTGLMMACQLAMHKVRFRIIDKKVKRENYSGAMILHSRSLEILHQLGISLKFLKEGIIARRINFQFNYSKNFALNIADFGKGWTLFPYVFLLEQYKTEKLLMACLNACGYQVEEGSSLQSFTQKNGIVTSIIKKADDKEEVVTSLFLIGAGGRNCIVRQQLQIPFHGVTHPDLLFVSDTNADMPALQAEMLFTFTKNQTLGFFPLPENKWRVDGAIPNLGKKAENVDFDYVVNYLDRDGKLNLQLVNSSWFSVFRSHSRHVPVMKHHHCFLAGDAAHVHTPVGAQGMNAGLHDAYNLAWKIGFFLNGKARISILETYEEERLPVVKKIVNYTDKVYLWITDERPFIKFLRLYPGHLFLKTFIFLVNRFQLLRKIIFNAVSGIGVAYRKSSLTAHITGKRLFEATPQPGERLPCFQYFIGSNVYNLQEKIKYTSYRLLLFGIDVVPENILSVAQKFDHVLETEIIPVNPGTEEIYRKMVTKELACYLVRPDLYIAWKSDSLDANGLEKYLLKFFIASNETQEL